MHRFLKTAKDIGPSPPKRPRLISGGELPPVAQQHAFLDLAKKRDWAGLKESLSASPSLLNVQPAGRWTALHQASSAGHADAVTYLLERGADTSLRTNDGKTALEVASSDKVVSLLKDAESRQVSACEAAPSTTIGGAGLDVCDQEVSCEDVAPAKGVTGVWQVQPSELPKTWVDMGAERQALLNDASAACIWKAVFREGGRTYIFDLEAQWQRDFITGDVRPIRFLCTSVLPDAKQPAHDNAAPIPPIPKEAEKMPAKAPVASSSSNADGEKLAPGETIEVPGSGAKPYIVKNCGGGVWSCTCVNWKMQGKLPTNQRSCKHIVGVRGAESEQQRLASGSSAGSSVASLPKASRATPLEKPEGVTAAAPALLLANKWEAHVDPTGWWISEKLDGMRAYWDPDKQCLLSRLGNAVLCPKHLLASLPDVPLDGELFLGRGRFQELMSVVKNSANVGRIDGPWKDVVYVVFDMPKHGGKFEDRMEALKSKLGVASTSGSPTFAKFHEHRLCKGHADLEQELKKVENHGGEGLMLRRAGSLYEGGRSSSLLKVKTFHDEEAVVIGHELGKGRNSAVTGALRCRNRAKIEFSVGTGLNDAQRANPPKVGEIITYRYFELTKDNKPRFPSFVGIRADADRTGLGL